MGEIIIDTKSVMNDLLAIWTKEILMVVIIQDSKLDIDDLICTLSKKRKKRDDESISGYIGNVLLEMDVTELRKILEDRYENMSSEFLSMYGDFENNWCKQLL